jgi:hypothetical protein
MTQTAVDLIDAAIEVLRPELERTLPIKVRIKAFWAAVKVARQYGSRDVVAAEFMRLARETGLVADLGRLGEEDAAHVADWALKNMNPFEVGPLR